MNGSMVPLFLILMLAMSPANTACSSGRPITPAPAMGALPKTERDLDVPYVPTPKRVVDKMLEMAKVGPDDTVYDLGCGDGRLVVTAAKEKGAKGVGVDLSPARIEESNQNAARAQVKDHVTFLQQDLFETDISEASVLTMYLLPEVNLMLRPKIFSQLKPGSRVVSHDFDMDDWEPDAEARVGSSRVYYWVVPANVSGIWELSVQTGERLSRYSLVIDQTFQKVEGIAISGSFQAVLKDATLKGDALQFSVEQRIGGRLVPMRFEGRIVGDSIQGTMTGLPKHKGARIAWSAQRDPQTALPIDGSLEKLHAAIWT